MRNELLKHEIEKATEELKEALIANIELSEQEDNIKLAKIASHKRLQMAKDVILNI